MTLTYEGRFDRPNSMGDTKTVGNALHQAPSESTIQTPETRGLKDLLRDGDSSFVPLLKAKTKEARSFSEVLALNTLRKRASQTNLWPSSKSTLRLAIIGGCSLRPLADLIEHFTIVLGDVNLQLWTGDYDNYISEIMDEDSNLYTFKPELVFVLPSERRCRYTGRLADPLPLQEAEANQAVTDILGLIAQIYDRSGASVVVGNFRLPPYFDPGAMRNSGLSSEYAFRKYVNYQIGLNLPAYAHICDIEFLANRLGTVRAFDERTWFESKQPFSTDLMVEVAREFAILAASLKRATKKVIVLDLDNTLWGGVIGDDGLEGIEIGTTSPRGEAYRDFQQTLLEISKRGVLLAVCSKNDHDKAIEPFLKHPEMVLRLSNIVNFKANWEPKSENIRQIALELNLGVDSFVFFDDNPAEIDIVKQFVPEVDAIWLGEDPSTYAATLKDCRHFEMRSVTKEDLERVQLYQQEAKRQELQSTATDMDAYLSSLEMTATISEFTPIDVPRITQLINKSNQFNLTTQRRTEVEVRALISSSDHASFTIRLSDRFGDHGLIAIVITKIDGAELLIDTWLMSCRVLKRQVEEATLNEIVRVAKERGCERIVGTYKPTAKNGMVRDLYPRLGFAPSDLADEASTYILDVANYSPSKTKIQVAEPACATI
jgi:FkbH-like protein